MDENEARRLLSTHVKEDGELGMSYSGEYLNWRPGRKKITIDMELTVDQLEAIAWWMRNNSASR